MSVMLVLLQEKNHVKRHGRSWQKHSRSVKRHQQTQGLLYNRRKNVVGFIVTQKKWCDQSNTDWVCLEASRSVGLPLNLVLYMTFSIFVYFVVYLQCSNFDLVVSESRFLFPGLWRILDFWVSPVHLTNVLLQWRSPVSQVNLGDTTCCLELILWRHFNPLLLLVLFTGIPSGLLLHCIFAGDLLPWVLFSLDFSSTGVRECFISYSYVATQRDCADHRLKISER